MSIKLYNPFEKMSFEGDTCFLTGVPITDLTTQKISVFPEWIIQRYNLEQASMAMHSGYRLKYQEMTMPASPTVVAAVQALDVLTQRAFEQGYEAVVQLPKVILFQWMARVMYGVLYQELAFQVKHHKEKGSAFQLSDFMQMKLGNLLHLLQSLIKPVVFEGFEPWTIHCFRVGVSKDVLNYKDETKKQNFCLGMNGFGILACLQDNGAVSKFHQDLLEKIGDKTLHPAQFEELYGRFMYANYLLRELPAYQIREEGDKLVFTLPEDERKHLPLFAQWQDNIFAQVLTNMLEPWGIPIQQIYRFPDPPVSYLINEMTQELIPASEIALDK